MISYEEAESEFWSLIAELGEVYIETVPGTSVLLEEYRDLQEVLLGEYEQKIEVLRKLSSRVINTSNRCAFSWNTHMMDAAVFLGCLEVLQFLRDGFLGEVVPWDEWTLPLAVGGGHLEVIQALRDGSLGGICPWNEYTIAYAAYGDHLNILRVFRDGSLGGVCPWDARATLYASQYGHLEVLRALRDGSLGGVCPWNKGQCKYVGKTAEIIALINSGELD